MESVLIIGGDSHIGRAVSEELAGLGVNVVSTTRRHDISQHGKRIYLNLSDALDDWRAPQVDACVITSAVTSLQACKSDSQRSAMVNVTATVKLARKLANQGSYVLFLSSNQVFDGALDNPTSDVPVNPKTEYGRQKVLAEQQLLELGNNVGVLRLSKVLSDDNPLLRQWLRNISRNQTIEAFEDMHMAPVTIDFAAHIIVACLEHRWPGVMQASGDEDISYYQMALMLAEQFGADQEQVVNASVEAIPGLEHNPRYTRMNMQRLERLMDIHAPSSIDCIHHIIGNLRALTADQVE